MAHGRPQPLAALPQKIIQPCREVLGEHLGCLFATQLTPQRRQFVDLLTKQARHAGQGGGHVYVLETARRWSPPGCVMGRRKGPDERLDRFSSVIPLPRLKS